MLVCMYLCTSIFVFFDWLTCCVDPFLMILFFRMVELLISFKNK
nr:MAG TPA: hypothetical protein [Bacteriophage sp.]